MSCSCRLCVAAIFGARVGIALEKPREVIRVKSLKVDSAAYGAPLHKQAGWLFLFSEFGDTWVLTKHEIGWCEIFKGYSLLASLICVGTRGCDLGAAETTEIGKTDKKIKLGVFKDS